MPTLGSGYLTNHCVFVQGVSYQGMDASDTGQWSTWAKLEQVDVYLHLDRNTLNETFDTTSLCKASTSVHYHKRV